MNKTLMLASLVLTTTALAGCDKKAEPAAEAPAAEVTTEAMPAAEAAPTDAMAPDDAMAPADVMAPAPDAAAPPPAEGADDRGGNETNRR